MAVFTPLDLSRWHSAGQEVSLWHPALSQRFAQMPGGALTAWGIPFALATDGDGAPRWIILGRDAQPLNLPLDEAAAATHVIVAHFCNTAQRAGVDPAGIPPASSRGRASTSPTTSWSTPMGPNIASPSTGASRSTSRLSPGGSTPSPPCRMRSRGR
ncbi:MAG: hypothetical protein M5R40_15025 [Anaerolineae bacterium]|nr:hypothetical protein [Anaerolineae bacterium]